MPKANAGPVASEIIRLSGLVGVGQQTAFDGTKHPHLFAMESTAHGTGCFWARLGGAHVQWAFVADEAGSHLDLKLDTRTSMRRDGAPHAPILLTHWRGPQGMGQAGTHDPTKFRYHTPE